MLTGVLRGMVRSAVNTIPAVGPVVGAVRETVALPVTMGFGVAEVNTSVTPLPLTLVLPVRVNAPCNM